MFGFPVFVYGAKVLQDCYRTLTMWLKSRSLEKCADPNHLARNIIIEDAGEHRIRQSVRRYVMNPIALC